MQQKHRREINCKSRALLRGEQGHGNAEALFRHRSVRRNALEYHIIYFAASVAAGLASSAGLVSSAGLASSAGFAASAGFASSAAGAGAGAASVVVAAGAGAGAAAASAAGAASVAAGLASSAGFAASAAGAAGAASVVAGAAAAAGAAGVSSFFGSSAGLEASAVVAGAAIKRQISVYCSLGRVNVQLVGLTSRCGLGLGWLRGCCCGGRSCFRRLVSWLGCLSRLGLGLLLVLLLEDGPELGLQVVERVWCCGRGRLVSIGARRHEQFDKLDIQDPWAWHWRLVMSHGVTRGSSSPPLWAPLLPIEDEEVDDKVALALTDSRHLGGLS